MAKIPDFKPARLSKEDILAQLIKERGVLDVEIEATAAAIKKLKAEIEAERRCNKRRKS
jgi:hypothetical protein